MSFRRTAEAVTERLAARPVFSRQTIEEREVEGRVIRIPRVEDLEPDRRKRRAARHTFRKALNTSLNALSQAEIFKLSVLVRAVRGDNGDILAMARDTRATDRTVFHARQEEIDAGLALAAAQKVDLDADWSKS